MLYLTLMFEKAREKEYMTYSKVGLQAADNVFQWNVLEGLRENCGNENVRILNSVPIGNAPKYSNKIKFADEESILENGISMKNLGFLNLPLFKPFMRYWKYKKELKEAYKSGEKRVVVYGLYLPQLLALKKTKGLETILIVDDLPAQYGLVAGNCIVRYLKTYVGKCMMKLLNDGQTIQHFVFLTEHMKDVVDLQGRTYAVVEGIADSNRGVEPNQQKDMKKKVIYYGGTLNLEFGIGDLLEAFGRISKENYELWICGDGDARELVEEVAKKDSRIHYYGFVEKQVADNLQTEATVLVNPRKNKGEYTKYSFPSKTMEYLLGEKPIVMYKLAGIPKEYDAYLHYIETDETQAFADKLMEVCEDRNGSMTNLAREAKKWVLEQKNAKVQMEKLMKLWGNGD